MATGLRNAASALRVSRQTLKVRNKIIKAKQQELGIETKRSAAIARNQFALEKEAELLNLTNKERRKELEVVNELLQNSQNLTAEEKKSLKAQKEAIEQVNDLNQEQIEQLIEQNELIQKKIELYKNAIAAQKEALTDLRAGIVDLGKELTALQIGSVQGFDRTFGNLDKLASNFTGIGDLMKSVVGSFTKGQSVLNGVLGGINMVVNKSASLALRETLKIRTEIDKNRAELAKFTGSAFELRAEMNALKTSSEGLYLNYTESKTIIKSLYTNMYEYRDATAAQRLEMSKGMILYQRMGVNLGNVSKAFDFLIKVLGQSRAEANKTYTEIFGLAKALKIPPNIIQTQYAQAQDRLTIFGDASTRIFRDVAAVSSATGVEINNLFAAMKKFDTFEGAAKSAAKLNAYLRGPYLDTQKLLTMSDEERMLYIKEQIKSSGIDLENSNKMLKIGLAREAGFKNVTDFMKFMRTDQEKINEAMRESATISGKQESAMKGMRAATKESLTQDDRLARSINNAFGSDRGARRLLGLQKQIINQFDKMSGSVENYEKRMEQFAKIKALAWAAGMLFSMKDVIKATDKEMIPGFLKLAGVFSAIGLGMYIFKDGIGGAEKNTRGLLGKLNSLIDGTRETYVEIKYTFLKTATVFESIYDKFSKGLSRVMNGLGQVFGFISSTVREFFGNVKFLFGEIYSMIKDSPIGTAVSFVSDAIPDSVLGGALGQAASADALSPSMLGGGLMQGISAGISGILDSKSFGFDKLEQQKQKELASLEKEKGARRQFATSYRDLSTSIKEDPSNRALYESQIQQLMVAQRTRENSSLIQDFLSSAAMGADFSASFDPAIRGTTLGISENISDMAAGSGEAIMKMFGDMQEKEGILGEAATELSEVVAGLRETISENKEMQAILKIGDVDFKMFVENLLDAVLAGK